MIKEDGTDQAEESGKLCVKGDALRKDLVGVIRPQFSGFSGASKRAYLFFLSNATKELGVNHGQESKDILI